MDDYRKRLFRGAKVEDCILFFEENARKAGEHKNEASDDYEKGFWEGNRLAYQAAAQKLRWDFDYKKDEWEQEITKKVHHLIEAIDRMEQSARDQASAGKAKLLRQAEPKADAVFLEKVREVPEAYMKGVMEGMATTYRLAAAKLRSELEAREGTERIGEILKDCVRDFERDAKIYEGNAEKTEDLFSKGFLEGSYAACQTVLKQLKLEL